MRFQVLSQLAPFAPDCWAPLLRNYWPRFTGIVTQACTSNEIPQGIGRFGLDKTNPIPIFGIPENENYLSKIRTKNGERVRWRRIGSSEISNILKPIDAYELFDAKGNTIAVFYLSPYHYKTSDKAPENFKISH